MFQAAHIDLWIGKTQILHDLSLTAAAGALTAIVGPNGSGKSTLLKAMVGDLPCRGRVSLDGTALRQFNPAQMATRRAVLPQSTRLAFPFTVQEVVALGLRAGLDAADEALIGKAIAAVGLTGLASNYYDTLSGGEQQRCQLARVLVQVWHPLRDGKASWLFLDEPVAALDIGHQLAVMQIARRYADQGGGVIAVMHDLNLTAMFADSIVLIHAGRKLCQGPPAAVLTDDHLSFAYSCDIRVNTAPAHGPSATPFILPQVAGV